MKHPDTKSIGLIIRDTHLYAVQLKADKQGVVIKNVSRLALEEGIVEDDCIILNPEAFKAAIHTLLSKGLHGAFRESKVFITLPEEKIFSHQLTVPKDKAKDPEFIRQSASDYIPIELEEAVFDAQVINEDPVEGTVTFECVAVQSNIVKPIMDILKEAGLEVVEIDISTNALIRAFQNQFSPKDEDFALVYVQPKQDVMVLVSQKGAIYKHLLKHPQQLAGDANAFSVKFRQLMSMVRQKETLDIKTVYLVGSGQALSILSQTLSQLFPQAQTQRSSEFIHLPEGMENDLLEGVGLCLRGFEGGTSNHFNLITADKKQEMMYARITRQAQRFSVAAVLLLGALLVWLGIGTIKTYFDYQFSAKEAAILTQQLANPYVTELAKIRQQANQKQSQVLAIFNEILPLGGLLSQLDASGGNGVEFTAITYLGKNLRGEAEVQIRARADSREATEAFVQSLEASGLYTEVNSPLSNLVGKGQRFINVSLLLDAEQAKRLLLN